MANRNKLLEHLKELSPAQFEEVLFRLNIDPSIIPSLFAEQTLRAIRVIQRLEQEQDGWEHLEKTLAEPAISIIGENYIGYEIEAQVKRIISEYTQQPFEGREAEKRRLDEFVINNSSGVLLVTAAAGFGKSALLSHWQQTRQEDFFIAYHCFSYRSEKTRLVSEAYRHLLKQLYLYYNIRNGEFPSDENGMRDILVGMLGKPVSLEGKRLVIVLDGLDEAAKTFEPFFTELPAGVFVIASARAESGDEPEYLRRWTDNAERLCLKRLSREAIAKWLGQVRELAVYSQDNEFVTSLDETTDGFPLYLRFLIDDLRQAAIKNQDVQAVVRNSPGGFKAYVKEQFRLLAKVEEIKRQREVQELFALLSVALGALAEDDIEDLTSLSAWDLVDLPWQATRWFSIQMGFYSFAHPLLADEFQGVLGRQADLAEGKLIDYCARWQKHHRAYALRYYAEHLSKAKRWEELYAIARDEDFTSTQRQHLPNEPDLPLKTVQTALLGAAEEDKAEKMAEFLLLHAHRLAQTNTQESPLDALRSGSLERALRLAEQYEIERCILWYLLLTWELKDEGKLDDARETLEKLQKKELPRFSINWATEINWATGWQVNFAAYLLAHIFEVSKETCIALSQKLFEDVGFGLLCDFLIKRGEVKATLEIIRTTFPSRRRVRWMCDIAKVQMGLGQREEAKVTFAEAIETAHQIENSEARTSILIDIANSQADVGLFSDAHETLQPIEIRGASEDSWISFVEVRVKIVDKEQAIILLNQAKQLAQELKDKSRSYIIERIAILQAEIGQLTDALQIIEELASFNIQYLIKEILSSIANKEEYNEKEFNAVVRTLSKITEKTNDPRYQEKILETTVAVQVKKAQLCQEDFTVALTTAKQIKNKRCKAQALLIIVDAQTKLRWFDQALATANMIDFQDDKNEALLAILQKQAIAGQFEDAFSTRSKIKEQSKQDDALIEIATAYAQDKNFIHAIKIADRLLSLSKKVQLLNFIATIQSQLSFTKESRNTLARGLNTSLNSNFLDKQALTLLNIAGLLRESPHGNRDKWKKSLAYAKNVHEISKKINDVGKKVSVLAVLGEVYGKAGHRKEAKDIFSEAIEIVQRVEKQNYSIQVNCFIVVLFTQIGVAQARAGEFDAVLETVKKISSEEKSLVLKTLAQTHLEVEQKEILRTTITTIYDNYENTMSFLNLGVNPSVKTLSWIAVARMVLGERQDREAALAIFAEASEIVEQEKTEKIKTKTDSMLSTLAIAQAMGGQVEQAFCTAEKVLTNRNQLLCQIAIKLIQLKDKDNFKKQLIPCAYSFNTAYKMCGCLAYLYPTQATDVAKIVKTFTVSST